jgi:hypothetical protein
MTWTERTTALTASDAGENDYFNAVALSADGSVMAVGARAWAGTYSNQGAVYVFDWNGSSWVERTTALTASNAFSPMYFATDVALSADGSVLAVGSFYANGYKGGFYVFDWNGSSWVERSTAVLGSNTGSFNKFAGLVALNGDGTVLAAGTEDWDGSAGSGQGAVYVFDWNGSSWVERTTALTASNAASGDGFGSAVALSADGSVMAVGARGFDISSPGSHGAVYVFDWNGSSWVERTTALTPSNAVSGNFFGGSVALSADGSVLSVGAFSANSYIGAVYVFDWNGSSWTERTTALTASDAVADSAFGSAVALSADGSVMAVGARDWDGAYSNQGAVYVFDGPTSDPDEITPNAVAQSVTIDGVTLTPNSTAIFAFGIDQDQSLGIPILSQGFDLDPDEVGHAQTVDQPGLTQANTLTIQDLTNDQTVDQPGLTQANTLTIQDLINDQTVDQPGLTQANTLTIQDLTNDQTVDQPGLTQANTLTIQDLINDQTVDQPGLTQANTLTIQDLTNDQTVDQPDIVQANSIPIQYITNSQSVDAASLVVSGSIVVQAVSQSVDLAIPNLTQAHVLLPVGVVQSQFIETTSLAEIGVLSPDGVGQAHSIDAALLVVSGALEVQGLSQVQILESLVLLQNNVLAPLGVMQEQSVDTVSLVAAAPDVSPNSVLQLQSIDDSILSQYNVISIDSITQQQILDATNLGGLVVGELAGKVVVYAALNSKIAILPALSGDVYSVKP